MTQDAYIDEIAAVLRKAAAGETGLKVAARGENASIDALAHEVNQLLARLEDQKQQDLIRQGSLFETILNQLPTEFVMFDDQYRFVFINRLAIKDPEMRAWLIGKKDVDFFIRRGLPLTRAKHRHEVLEEVFRTGQVLRFSEAITDSQGKQHHLIRTTCPIFDDAGKPYLVAGFSVDVTELVEKESRLQEQNEALEKVNHELDQFVYRASHDLKAPLSSLLGVINMFELENPEAKNARMIEMMKRSIYRMDTFIKDIVHHSKNARQDLVLEVVDLREAISDSMEQLRHMPEARSVDFQMELDLQAPVVSDGFRIGILLNNLLSNAIKYKDTRKEHPYARVLAFADANEVQIRVEDNGIGIGEAHQAKVFSMFYRATRLATGSGIGLYIVQEVARRLGGAATLSSEEGAGTTFSIRFPNHPLP